MALPRTILVATDFSEHADQALEYAAQLAAGLDAAIHLLHVVTVGPMAAVPELDQTYSTSRIQGFINIANGELATRASKYRDRVTLGPVRVDVGDARDVIDRVAEEIGADLIVMGTHGRRGIRRALLGSVAESVMRTAPCPVLTIRPTKKAS